MERLTEEHPSWIDEEFWTAASEPDDEEITDVYLKLKAYEDTGLEPEAVNALKLASMGKAIAEITEFEGVSINHLCDLVRAEQKRREGCKYCNDASFLQYGKYIDGQGEVVGVNNCCINCGWDLRGDRHDD